MDYIEKHYISYVLRVQWACFNINSRLQQFRPMPAMLQVLHQSNFMLHFILTHEQDPPVN